MTFSEAWEPRVFGIAIARSGDGLSPMGRVPAVPDQLHRPLGGGAWHRRRRLAVYRLWLEALDGTIVAGGWYPEEPGAPHRRAHEPSYQEVTFTSLCLVIAAPLGTDATWVKVPLLFSATPSMYGLQFLGLAIIQFKEYDLRIFRRHRSVGSHPRGSSR